MIQSLPSPSLATPVLPQPTVEPTPLDRPSPSLNTLSGTIIQFSEHGRIVSFVFIMAYYITLTLVISLLQFFSHLHITDSHSRRPQPKKQPSSPRIQSLSIWLSKLSSSHRILLQNASGLRTLTSMRTTNGTPSRPPHLNTIFLLRVMVVIAIPATLLHHHTRSE